MLNYNEKADYTGLQVLYENNHLIAVYKPGGILVQGDYTGEITLIDIVRKYIADTYNKKGNVYLGLIHRLDKPAFGLVLFAKTSKGASRMSKQFREHQVKKIYYAVVEGKMPAGKPKRIIKSYIRREGSKSIVTKIKEKNSQSAELSYKVTHTHKGLSLLKVELITGRKHQIRSQLSNEGYPILGDKKYSAKKNYQCDFHYSQGKSCIALQCTEMSFAHPTKQEQVTIKTDLPEDWKKLLSLK